MVPRVVKAILVIIVLKPVLTCRTPDLHSTPNSTAGTTTVVCSCSSTLDPLIATFNGVDLTWTSSSGQEYQRTLIREGILVGRCAESNGEITCVFYTSIAKAIFECCAGLCDNITLLPPFQTASPGPTNTTNTTTLEPAGVPPFQTASPGPTNTTTLEPAGDGAPDVGWLLLGVGCAACLFIFIFVCFICLIRGCKNQHSLPPGVEPVGRDDDDSNEENSSPEHITVHDTDPDHEMEMVLPSSCSTRTRHQPRQVSYRHNPADPDVPHSERTDLPPVLQLFPSGDADVADTFKDNPQTAIDMGEDTEDDHPPAVSSPSADSKAPSDLGTIQFHYNLIKNEYSPVDTEPGATRLGVALQGERSVLYKYSECSKEHVSITIGDGELPTSGTDPVPLLSPNLSASEEATKSDNNGGESVVPQPSVDQQGDGSIEGSELQIIPLTNPQNPEIHYAHVNPKPKPEGLPDQPVDPTAVVYSEVKKEKLVPKSEGSEQPPQTKTAPPTPPPPPTAESLLSIIHPVACKWKEFGIALGIDEDRLDDFSNEAHGLHDMVHYYFSNVRVKHTWEEFVQALGKIGEYECADKIVREKRLEAHSVTVHPPNANGEPPTVVPAEPLHVEDLGSSYPVKHKPNDEAVQMPVPVHMCTPNLKMTSADKLDVEEQHHPIEPEVTVHPPNANGEPPTTVVPTDPVKHKPNDEAVQMPVPVHNMCTSNLKMTSADKLDSAEVTVHPPNANGDPPTTVVPAEPIRIGSGYPVKHKPNDEAVQMPVPVYMCTPNLKTTSADKPDVEEQHHPIEPGGVIPASWSPLLPTPDNHM